MQFASRPGGAHWAPITSRIPFPASMITTREMPKNRSASVKFRKAAKRWLKGGGERLGSEAQVPCRYTRPARREPRAASLAPS
jgi:hypothetical protein